MRVKRLAGACVLGIVLGGCFLSTVIPPKEIKSPEGTSELKMRQDSYECAKEAQLPSLAGNTPGPTIATAAYEGGKGQYTACMMARGYQVIW
jgi:hypothetical protein